MVDRQTVSCENSACYASNRGGLRIGIVNMSLRTAGNLNFQTRWSPSEAREKGESKMKTTVKLFAIALSLGLSLVAASSSAYAATDRAATAYSSYHVEQTSASTTDSALCVYEDNGAVVNGCTDAVNFVFYLPIDTENKKTITVQDYWNGPDTFTDFNCVSYAYTGKNSSSTEGTQITFTETSQSLSTTVTPTDTDAIQVICWQVPPQEGLALLLWNK
jgi:hypothetical protein